MGTHYLRIYGEETFASAETCIKFSRIIIAIIKRQDILPDEI
jgi:hypothetical protein